MTNQNHDEVIDKGHVQLITDLKEIMELAEKKEFHDFENTNFAAPKMMLVMYLNDILTSAKQGEYDN